MRAVKRQSGVMMRPGPGQFGCCNPCVLCDDLAESVFMNLTGGTLCSPYTDLSVGADIELGHVGGNIWARDTPEITFQLPREGDTPLLITDTTIMATCHIVDNIRWFFVSIVSPSHGSLFTGDGPFSGPINNTNIICDTDIVMTGGSLAFHE